MSVVDYNNSLCLPVYVVVINAEEGRRTLLAKAFFLFRDSKMKICRCVCDVVAFFFSPSLKEFARIWLVVVFLVVSASHSSGGSKGRFHHRLTGGCSSGRPCCDADRRQEATDRNVVPACKLAHRTAQPD